MASGLVFATVGSTKFDSLVSSITQEDALKALKKRGYTHVKLQIGKGATIPDEKNGEKVGINITYYRYKDNIEEDIVQADLVISHGGAGSCLEVLEKEKPLIVVVNDELMHNHQTEIADKLSSEGYVYSCSPATLCETIESMDFSKLKKFPKSDPNLFPRFLDNFMGFRSKEE